MRLLIALVTIACLSACGGSTDQRAQSEAVFVPDSDATRQRQAVLDAEAIMRGMAQARQRQAEMARSAR
jgi:hypothetical protein